MNDSPEDSLLNSASTGLPDLNGINPELSLLSDSATNSVLVGRKQSLYNNYGLDASLFIGRVQEQALKGKNVFLDSLNPHVIFVCGARGSGKSYCLGVLAEELSKKNPNVATVVIDPVGVFWGMKFPNKEEKELALITEWGLAPEGVKKLRVFVPKGVEKTAPHGTFDDVFTIKPSLLSSNDWALTFGIERFSPTGLLLDKVLSKVQRGFINLNGKKHSALKNFSITDLVYCLENDSEINSRERGYKSDSVRALSSRFEAAKSWGVFDTKGTPLIDICREGYLTVIDTSFLDDNVTALVVGVLARRILAARKTATRKEAAERLENRESADSIESDIPATWLFIDEAHTLIPSGNMTTAASSALIEYVKQGRRPGCSLVFATQQPSAIDARVLSQLDIILTHKLVFNDDIKAVIKRTPTIMPHKYKNPNFIKMLPVGIAITGDRREETSRAFVLDVRPRLSQHEGREAETVEKKRKLTKKQVLVYAFESIFGMLQRKKQLSFSEIEGELSYFNEKYLSDASLDDLLKLFQENDSVVDMEKKLVLLKEIEEVPEDLEEVEEETEIFDSEPKQVSSPNELKSKEVLEPVSILMFKPSFKQSEIPSIVNKFRKKGFLFFGSKEFLESFSLKGVPVHRIEFNYFNEKNAFKQGELFVNSLTGEFLHYDKGKLVESKNINLLYGLSEDEAKLIKILSRESLTRKQLTQKMIVSKPKLERMISNLKGRKVVSEIITPDNDRKVSLLKKPDMPSTPLHPLMNSLKNIDLVESDLMLKTEENYPKEKAVELIKNIWKKIVVTKTSVVYWPAIEAVFRQENGQTRKILIDGLQGGLLDKAK